MELGFGPSLDLGKLRDDVAALAERGIYVGTSSWKYPGWVGQLYDEQRYLHNGKLSMARFNRTCLEEYATVFKSVCVDAGYYAFPTEKQIEGLVAQVPEDFLFSFKVTEEITVSKFTNLPRYGPRAGMVNDSFLDPLLFANAFLKPLHTCKQNIGMLIFEFSRFHKGQLESGSEFVERLDEFFGELPEGPQYGIEIRNRTFLHPEYFEVLQRHNVAHVFNNWTHMPPISEQIAMDGAFTADGFGARFLLTPGRDYKTAVANFEPYTETKEVDDDARGAGTALMERQPKGKSYLYVNNRLEGSAIRTILAMIDQLNRKKD
jgi:uncharacterized protein YecE (DUF72 family)